jgi:hypothetical protein
MWAYWKEQKSNDLNLSSKCPQQSLCHTGKRNKARIGVSVVVVQDGLVWLIITSGHYPRVLLVQEGLCCLEGSFIFCQEVHQSGLLLLGTKVTKGDGEEGETQESPEGRKRNNMESETKWS